MDTKELLELAAKAACVKIEPCTCHDKTKPFLVRYPGGTSGHWAPNVDNAYSRRLQIALRMSLVFCENDDGEFWQASAGEATAMEWVMNHNDDHEAAARLAVLRCAARVAQLHGVNNEA